jgi:hypothetical protein
MISALLMDESLWRESQKSSSREAKAGWEVRRWSSSAAQKMVVGVRVPVVGREGCSKPGGG